MGKTIQAGSPALRKALRRFPGFSLVSCGGGGHAVLVAPDGTAVRLPDGRRFVVPCSPRSDSFAAATLVRRLEALGIRPR